VSVSTVLPAMAVAVLYGSVALVRWRRRRYLHANRPRVIKESLERARAKQTGYGPSAEGPAPPVGRRARRPHTGRRPRDPGPGGGPPQRT